MKIRMFEPLQPHTEVREHMTYMAGSDLLVTFNHRNIVVETRNEESEHYGYDLYDFDDLVFQTSADFSSLEDAKRAALSAATLLEAA